jgi:hypothetical protein
MAAESFQTQIADEIESRTRSWVGVEFFVSWKLIKKITTRCL